MLGQRFRHRNRTLMTTMPVQTQITCVLALALRRALWPLLMLVAGIASPALAQGTGTPGECLGRSDVLGLSRVVEIDTASGPRFGEQYEENVFLEAGEVVLTFDDGPQRRSTGPILDVLDRHCVKATFFSVGRMAVADPDMLKEIDRRGHTIGSHTWSHKKLGNISQASATHEIELGVSAVAAALGKPIAPFFRFPYLSDPKSAQKKLRSRGQGIFGIDVDSRDFRTRSGSVMQKQVLSGLKKKGKGIILFHDIQRSTVRGLDGLLRTLKKRGYKVVHMVAKSPATSLAKYDAIAQKRVKRKTAARKANPLADRAVTWPNANGTGATTNAGSDEDLPWLKEPKPRRRPAAVKRVPPPSNSVAEDRWQIRPFGR